MYLLYIIILLRAHCYMLFSSLFNLNRRAERKSCVAGRTEPLAARSHNVPPSIKNPQCDKALQANREKKNMHSCPHEAGDDKESQCVSFIPP